MSVDVRTPPDSPDRHQGRSAAAPVAVGARRSSSILLVRCSSTARRPTTAYDWATYGKYLFDQRIFAGGVVTLELTVCRWCSAIVLGVMLAVMRLSPNPVLKSVAWVYLWIFRGTPVYVQLVFWGLFPTIYKNIQLGIPFGAEFCPHQHRRTCRSRFMLAVIGLGLNEAAYMAEIIRAGISSVAEGQAEASTALGMSWCMTMRRTVLPQAMRVIIPPTGNEVIAC